NWAYYMRQAQADAATLPSPPRLMPDPGASSPDTTATVTWTPARTCRASAVPITGYTVVAQPGGMTQTLPANATSASFTGLKVGTTYTFTVTVTNADGQDSATSNPVVAGACSPTATPVATSYFAWFDTATPGMDGDNIHLLNTGSSQSIGCVLLGSQAIPYSLGAGQSTHVKFRNGSIGGPVVVRVMTGAGVLASQRVQFNQSFNEVWSANAAQASTKSFFNWFDKASPGMLTDNIHVLNPGGTAADVTIQLPECDGGAGGRGTRGGPRRSGPGALRLVPAGHDRRAGHSDRDPAGAGLAARAVLLVVQRGAVADCAQSRNDELHQLVRQGIGGKGQRQRPPGQSGERDGDRDRQRAW